MFLNRHTHTHARVSTTTYHTYVFNIISLREGMNKHWHIVASSQERDGQRRSGGTSEIGLMDDSGTTWIDS